MKQTTGDIGVINRGDRFNHNYRGRATRSIGVRVIADDPKQIPYRKRLNIFTESALATIFLQQVIFREGSEVANWGHFYKFNDKCDHPLYKDGDSWMEELGFSKREFLAARAAISTKITKGTSKADVLKRKDKTALVIYWTDSNNVTYYLLNTPLLDEMVNKTYEKD